MENKITKNKGVAAVLLVMALIGFAVIVYRIAGYQYEYNVQFTPVDYGRFNVLSYFTIQSNFAACVYFLLASLAIFGVKKVKRIAFNPTFGALITLYVFVAGVTYNAGFPLKMTQHWTFDTFYHGFISFLQIYFHIIMVIAVLCLWLFPFTNQKIGWKTILCSGIYPLVYSLFSMARGALIDGYFPYPFYDPHKVWEAFGGGKPFSFAGAYGIIAVMLVFGIGLFIALEAILVLIHNKRIRHYISA